MPINISPIGSEQIWEQFLLQHAPQSLFQSWMWGDIQSKLGSKVWRLGVYEDKKLVGIAAIYKVVAKRGTYLHVRHGPILASLDITYWQQMLEVFKRLAKEERAWFIRVSPLIEPSQSNQKRFEEMGFLPSPMHAMDAELCWVLDVTPTEEQLLSNMRKSTRYEIRRAQKESVSIVKSDDPSDLAMFFRLYEATTQRHNFVGHKGIKEEFVIFSKERNGLLLLGKLNAKVVSGALILFYGNQAIYRHGASIRSTLPISSLVQWEAIREAKKRGLKVYNFWGIAPNENVNHPWRGITVFKKGFGGREIRYLHAYDYPTSPLYIVSKSIETVRRKIKGYDS